MYFELFLKEKVSQSLTREGLSGQGTQFEQKRESFASAGENDEPSLAAVEQARWGGRVKKTAAVEKPLLRSVWRMPKREDPADDTIQGCGMMLACHLS